MATTETSDEAVFEVWDVDPHWCEYPGCTTKARHEIRLIGSMVATCEVCGRHTRWAKSNLVARDMRHRGLIP